MAKGNTQLNLDENIEGALCYLLGFVTGIIFYFVEEDNDFVKFHSVQSTVLFGGIFLLFILGNALTLGAAIGFSFVGAFLAGIIAIFMTLIGILSVILWLLLMLKAYSGEKYKLPIVGNFAENFLK